MILIVLIHINYKSKSKFVIVLMVIYMSIKVPEPLAVKIISAAFKIIERLSRKRLLFLVLEGYALNPITKNIINGIVAKLEQDNLEKPEELLKITFGEDYNKNKKKKAAASEFLFAIIEKYKENIRR